MPMSRMRIELLVLALPAPLAAAPPTAEKALENYRRFVLPLSEIGCPPGQDPEEVVVCGRRDGPDPNRLPLPLERGSPRPSDLAGGEQLAAMNGGPGSCTPVGRNQRCSGGLSVIPIIVTAIKAAQKLLQPE